MSSSRRKKEKPVERRRLITTSVRHHVRCGNDKGTGATPDVVNSLRANATKKIDEEEKNKHDYANVSKLSADTSR